MSNLGAALYEKKDFEGAAASHRRATELNPAFARAHSNLGNALHALKRFEEAIVAYHRADTIQFVRYLPLLKSGAARVSGSISRW